MHLGFDWGSDKGCVPLVCISVVGCVLMCAEVFVMSSSYETSDYITFWFIIHVASGMTCYVVTILHPERGHPLLKQIANITGSVSIASCVMEFIGDDLGMVVSCIAALGFSALLWLSLNCCSSVTEKDEVETWLIQKASHNPTMNGLPSSSAASVFSLVHPTMQTHVNLQRVTESLH